MGELFDPTGEVALITAWSKGIGRALAERIGQCGAIGGATVGEG